MLHAGFGECSARKVVAAGGQAVIADVILDRAQTIAKELAPNCLAVQCNVTWVHAGMRLEMQLPLVQKLLLSMQCRPPRSTQH